jgi:hypothetical protein
MSVEIKGLYATEACLSLDPTKVKHSIKTLLRDEKEEDLTICHLVKLSSQHDRKICSVPLSISLKHLTLLPSSK